ncbi:UNVERIFIED_CONTAM: hypothetical protein HDU68_005156 [Siphonaria sp. JEL0065]|nr:hypothetical protein HDU68_005156 [Siphonaria sp. JEL0065]
MPYPQVAPIQLHAPATDDHPVGKANSNKKISAAEKARLALLYSTYPVLNPANEDWLFAAQRINPMVVDDDHVLADLAFDCQALVKQYPVAYAESAKKKALVNTVIQPNNEKEYYKGDFVRTTRLAAAVLPLHVEIHNGCRNQYTRIITRDDGVLTRDGLKHSGFAAHCSNHDVPQWPEDYADYVAAKLADGTNTANDVCVPITTSVHPVSGFSTYTNEHTAASTVSDPTIYIVEWYVSFTDQGVFQFNDSEKFASEEIKALENPILGSLRDCMFDLSRNGVLYQKQNFSKAPLIHTDIHFHLPKHKQKDEFRDSEIDPLSRDFAGLCTPLLIQGVPKLATITPGRLYGRPLTDTEMTYEILKKMTTTIPRSASRPKNNFVCMSAPDRLSNPLRPKIGAYTIYQIRQIFRTAYTAFRGVVLKSKETYECLREIDRAAQEKLTPADRFAKPKFGTANSLSAHSFTASISASFGSSNSLLPIEVVDPAAPRISHTKSMQVVIHTGDWGTGEFQNNPTVMAYLQIAAAYATGVDHLYYHVLKNYDHVETAHAYLKEVWDVESGEKVSLDKILRHLEGKLLQWGVN